MKFITSIYLIVAVLVGAAAWKYIDPLISKQRGTSVISALPDHQRGGKPATVKLPESLSNTSHELLAFAYQIAKEDGFKEPRYLQGIILQESKAGSMRGFRVAGLSNAKSDRYYGIGQVKLVAAKAVMDRWPEMWKFCNTRTDEELQARLIVDDHFNIRVASKYVLLMGINENPSRAIAAYNLGPGGVREVDPKEHAYTKSVKSHADRMKNDTSKRQVIRSAEIPSQQVELVASRR